jgi:ubiquinone/menaquinone biosynthesis C-methylase UbiE
MNKIKDEYIKWADIYDKIYSWKDYEKESKRIDALIKKYKISNCSKLLDIACGTGKHIKYLRKKYDVKGIDLSNEMLKHARKNNKGIFFKKGNMTDFKINEKFDVLICLFSAIAHLKNYKELNKTIRNFTLHLNPGGIIIIEPFLQKKDIRSHLIDHSVYEDEKSKIIRMAVHKVNRLQMLINFHFLVAANNKIKHFTENAVLTMFEKDKFINIMKSNGLKTEFIKDGLMKSRGLYIGIKN